MSKILINNTVDDIEISDIGRVVPGSGQLEIDIANYPAFSRSSELLSLMSGENPSISYSDGSNVLALSDAVDHLKGFSQKLNMSEGRTLTADNRIPGGYSLYITGASDDIAGGINGGGEPLKFSLAQPTRSFQMLKHWYVIGARASWENCTSDNYFNATLVAPATVGVEAAGDFNKYPTGLGFNLFVPAAPGQGAWNLDLGEKLPNTNVLKAVPVPVAGNTGFFDYDADNNSLTVNYGQQGGYNLYDIQLTLHAFARYLWGRSINGEESSLDITGLVGKKIFNFWKVDCALGNLNAPIDPLSSASIVLILGSQGNV